MLRRTSNVGNSVIRVPRVTTQDFYARVGMFGMNNDFWWKFYVGDWCFEGVCGDVV